MVTANQELVQVKYSMIAGQYGGQIIFPSDWARDDLTKTMLEIPSEADLFTQSSGQKYPLGAQLRLHGNLYRYSRMGETNTSGYLGFLKCNRIIVPGSGGNSAHYGYEGGPYSAIAAGDTHFHITDTAAVKNEYEGATLQIYDDTADIYDQYTVLGNDASDGTSTCLYIAPPGFNHLMATSGVTLDVYLSPYYSVGSLLTAGNQSYCSAIGMARIGTLTSGYFFWLQTAGECFGTGASTWPGQTAYYRDVYANTDGSLIHYTAGYQRVGYLRNKTASNYGDVCFMLQLDQ